MDHSYEQEDIDERKTVIVVETFVIVKSSITFGEFSKFRNTIKIEKEFGENYRVLFIVTTRSVIT
jgi:hypothetical protein